MDNTIQRPRIALTPGEPAGIGPDLTLQLVQQPLPVELIAIADPDLLMRRAEALQLPLHLHDYCADNPPQAHISGHLTVLPVRLNRPAQAGQLDLHNAAYVLTTLRRATQGCLTQEFAAVVTGPVHKGIINEAGIPFTGHTEFFAAASHTPQVVMMLTAKTLRVALATTHLPLAEVAPAITAELLTKVITILHDDLRHKYGIATPRILVCGLNPHAGENGHLGHEEVEIILPTLDKLRRGGMLLDGPVPADTAFIPKRLAQTDAVLAMYHDQGLPVLKYVGFGQAINVTLGLPFIRTSVDHGTALELAGTGHADVTSLRAALDAAVEMIHHSTRTLSPSPH